MNRDELGEAAYNEYCEHRKWISYRNEPLPKWDEVDPEIKEGWVKAAMAVGVRIADFILTKI